MGTIRTFRKRNRFPIGAAGVPGDASALSVESRAISRFAQTVGIISAAEGRRIMKADEKSQTIAGEAEMKRLLNATWDTFDTNPKENDYLPAYKKTEKGFDSLIKGYTNRNAQTNLRLFREQNRPAWENSVNDAVLNRKRINAGARAIKNIEAIKSYDLSNPGEKLEAEGLIGQSGDVMRGLGHSPDEVENWMAGALNSVENQEVYQQAQKLLAVKGLSAAQDWVMKQKHIDVDSKKGIISDINFEASQSKLKLDQQIEKIEQDYVSKYHKEQLSSNEVVANPFLPASRKLFWKNIVDAQTEERLNGEKERNWDKYDELQKMTKEYNDGVRTDEDEIRDEIGDAVEKKQITSTDGMKLLDRVKRTDDADDPMNRSDAKRGLGFLEDLESAEISANKDEPYEAIRGIRLKYQKKKNEFERWIKRQEKLTDTDIQNKVAEMTEAETEEVVLNWFESLMRPKEGTPFFGRFFGTTEETALARKKAKAGVKEERKEKSPYPEYPDAFLEDGVWKVKKDGKTYRIE